MPPGSPRVDRKESKQSSSPSSSDRGASGVAKGTRRRVIAVQIYHRSSRIRLRLAHVGMLCDDSTAAFASYASLSKVGFIPFNNAKVQQRVSFDMVLCPKRFFLGDSPRH